MELTFRDHFLSLDIDCRKNILLLINYRELYTMMKDKSLVDVCNDDFWRRKLVLDFMSSSFVYQYLYPNGTDTGYHNDLYHYLDSNVDPKYPLLSDGTSIVPEQCRTEVHEYNEVSNSYSPYHLYLRCWSVRNVEYNSNRYIPAQICLIRAALVGDYHLYKHYKPYERFIDDVIRAACMSGCVDILNDFDPKREDGNIYRYLRTYKHMELAKQWKNAYRIRSTEMRVYKVFERGNIDMVKHYMRNYMLPETSPAFSAGIGGHPDVLKKMLHIVGQEPGYTHSYLLGLTKLASYSNVDDRLKCLRLIMENTTDYKLIFSILSTEKHYNIELMIEFVNSPALNEDTMKQILKDDTLQLWRNEYLAEIICIIVRRFGTCVV